MSTGHRGFPWDRPLRGRVFGCLRPREIAIRVLPGVGHVDGGRLFDVPIDVVPIELRIPNTDVWVQADTSMNIVKVWRRNENE